MSNLLAAVGRGQLQGLDGEGRRAAARSSARYRDAFADAPGIGFMPDAPDGEPTNWLTVVTVDEAEFGATPTTIREHLETLDIEAVRRGSRCTCSRCSPTARCAVARVAEEIFRTGLCLPSGSAHDRRRHRARRRAVCSLRRRARVAAAVEQPAQRVLEARPPAAL